MEEKKTNLDEIMHGSEDDVLFHLSKFATTVAMALLDMPQKFIDGLRNTDKGKQFGNVYTMMTVSAIQYANLPGRLSEIKKGLGVDEED